jgi:hypothetical protein
VIPHSLLARRELRRVVGPADLSTEHVYIKSRTPQLNGKVERSHRTDKDELHQLLTYRDDVDLEKKLAEWEHFYNYNRPHGAHDGKTPSTLAKTSGLIPHITLARILSIMRIGVARAFSGPRRRDCVNFAGGGVLRRPPVAMRDEGSPPLAAVCAQWT